MCGSVDYVYYRVYADLGSLTFAWLAAHGFSSSLAFPVSLLYLLPLPWPCLTLRFTSTAITQNPSRLS